MRAAVVTALAALALASSAAAATQPQIRRVDLSKRPLVRVTAVVPVGSRPTLTENGVPAQFVSAKELGAAGAIALALDNSKSMAGTPLREAKAAAEKFLAQERSVDSISAVAFAHGARPLSFSGSSRPDVAQALEALAPASKLGTSLYDAVVLSAHRLRQMTNGTRILVLLTDGHDLGSKATLAQAVNAARRADVVVYGIAAGRHAALRPLEQLATATGGRVFDAADVTRLGAVYRNLGRELDRTWQLSYLTRARPGDRLALTVQAGGGVAREDVRLPSESGGAGLIAIPRGLASNGLTAVVVVALVALLLAGAGLAGRRSGRRPDIARLLDPHVAARAAQKESTGFLARFSGLFDWTEQSMAELPGSRRLEHAVERSGLRLRVGQVPYVGALSAFVLGVLGTIASGSSAAVVGLMLLGLVTPFVALVVAGARRSRAFDRQLADVLATIASTLRAGHGLKQALQAIADDSTPPASEEFARVLTEERLGRPLDQAIAAMCERIGSIDLEYVATAVNVQAQVGGSLASLFDTVSETVRERQRHVRKVSALTAMGRMSALVLILMPIGLALLMTLISPSYMRPLYVTSAGHALIVFSFASMTIGALILKRVVKVRY